MQIIKITITLFVALFLIIPLSFLIGALLGEQDSRAWPLCEAADSGQDAGVVFNKRVAVKYNKWCQKIKEVWPK